MSGSGGCREARVSGRLRIEELAQAAREGAIDTVVCAFTDMQGRLVG